MASSQLVNDGLWELGVADRGYDHDNYRREVWRRGVKPSIARCGTKHGSRLGRWMVQRSFAWLHILTLACALICRRYLMGFETGSRGNHRSGVTQSTA